MRRRLIRPCARGSTGNWGRLRCGMRREWRDGGAHEGHGLAAEPRASRHCWRPGKAPGTRAMGARASSRRRESWSQLRRFPDMRGLRISGARTAWCGATPGASLVDLGDGIGCIELHSLKNAIGGDVVAMVFVGAESGFRCGARLCGLCDYGRSRQLQRGREPDATAAGGAGGRVGRGDCGHSRVPADDGGDQVLPAAGGGGAVWNDAGRRHGDLPARGATAASCGDVYRTGGGGSGADSRRRRDEGDAAAGGGCGRRAGAARSEGSAFAVCAVGGDGRRR